MPLITDDGYIKGPGPSGNMFFLGSRPGDPVAFHSPNGIKLIVGSSISVDIDSRGTVRFLTSVDEVGGSEINAASSTAFTVAAGGSNYAFQVDTSTASAATGLRITAAAAGNGAALDVVSSGANEALTIDAKGSGTITVGGTSTGAITFSRATGITGALTVTSAGAAALSVGANGNTNPVFRVVASTASVATGLAITGAAATAGCAVAVISSGTNEALTLDAKGSGTITIGSVSTGAITLSRATGVTGAATVTSAGASALAVGANGATNPVIQVDASTGSAATGLKLTGAAAAGGFAMAVISSGTDESLTLDAKGAGTITVGSVSTGAITLTRATGVSAALTVTSNAAAAFAVGPNGNTNPVVRIVANVASAATGIVVTGAAAAGGCALAVISSGTDESFTIDAKGAGVITIGGVSTGGVKLEGPFVFNDASADVDARWESNALANFLYLDASECLNGTFSIGAVAPTNPQCIFAVLPPANATGVTANQSYFHVQVLPGGAVVVPAGTAPVVASVNLHEPNITATGTVTDACTLRIVDAPTEGTNNHALWVDSGSSRFDGNILQGGNPGAATSAVRIILKKTGIADNSATDVITVTVPNANHAATIKLTILSSNGSTDAFESSRCAEGLVVLARTAGVATVAAVAALALAQIATVAAGATHTLAYGVSAITGAADAQQTFTIQLTIDDSGNTGSNQAVILAELINAEASGVTMAAA